MKFNILSLKNFQIDPLTYTVSSLSLSLYLSIYLSRLNSSTDLMKRHRDKKDT